MVITIVDCPPIFHVRSIGRASSAFVVNSNYFYLGTSHFLGGDTSISSIFDNGVCLPFVTTSPTSWFKRCSRKTCCPRYGTWNMQASYFQ